MLAQLRPGILELLMPLHKRPVVIGAKVVPVLYHEHMLDSGTYVFYRRQHPVGEYVLVYPRVGVYFREVAADSMQHGQAFILQAAMHHLHILPIILRPYM